MNAEEQRKQMAQQVVDDIFKSDLAFSGDGMQDYLQGILVDYSYTYRACMERVIRLSQPTPNEGPFLKVQRLGAMMEAEDLSYYLEEMEWARLLRYVLDEMRNRILDEMLTVRRKMPATGTRPPWLRLVPPENPSIQT